MSFAASRDDWQASVEAVTRRPAVRASGLRLDALAAAAFPESVSVTAGHLSMAVAARPARPTCDRRHDSYSGRGRLDMSSHTR